MRLTAWIGNWLSGPAHGRGALGRILPGDMRRYERALIRSNITIFTQDPSLRYTFVSTSIFGREIAEIIGRTDEEILPVESRRGLMALKAEALKSRQPVDGEVSVSDGGVRRWYDIHIEPLHDPHGVMQEITGVAVDITERKEGEAHLRMLMRELTHRSKNLLAVIQAMARQTARHSGSIEDFLDHFNARLQALATSHDLLVQEGWHGVSLDELTRSQIGLYLGRSQAQVSIEGPGVVLRPEVAQDLGLALHELAANAARHGALSVPAGKVSIRWSKLPDTEGNGIELLWSETGGPAVPSAVPSGFGRLVIERNLSRSLNSDVALAFPSDGVRCRVVIPSSQVALAS